MNMNMKMKMNSLCIQFILVLCFVTLTISRKSNKTEYYNNETEEFSGPSGSGYKNGKSSNMTYDKPFKSSKKPKEDFGSYTISVDSSNRGGSPIAIIVEVFVKRGYNSKINMYYCVSSMSTGRGFD